METLFEGKKLYAVIITFLLIIAFFSTFNNIRNHYQQILQNATIENKSTADLLSSVIYERQQAAINILESYAQRLSFIDAVKKKDFNHVIYHLQSLSKHTTEIDALFLTDQYGTIWANYPVDRAIFGKNLAYRDWYKGVSKNWRPYISTIYRRMVLEKGLAVAVSVPVFDRKGKVIGILSDAHRTSFLATFIKGNIIDSGKSITLLDQEGNIIFSNTVPYEENITKYPDAHVLEKAVAGVITNMEIADVRKKGNISYVSIVPVKEIGWSVIVGQDKNRILKSLYWYSIRSAATGFVTFLLLTVCLLYFRREYKYRKTKEIINVEEKYRSVVTSMVEGVCLQAANGELLAINPAAARIDGRSLEQILGRISEDTQWVAIYEDGRPFPGELHPSMVTLRTGEPQVNVIMGIHQPDGTLVWVSINSQPLISTGESRPYAVVTTFADITKRKQAEEALHAANLYNRSLIEASLDPLVTIGANGKITDVNAATEAVTGYTRTELIGTEFSDYFIEPEQARAGYEEVFRVGSVHDHPLELRHRDGHVTSVLYNASVYRDEKGQVAGVFAAARDISARKLAEAQLHASLREKEILLREIHHRVKNNMQVITGLLDLQAKSSGNKELIELLLDSQRRIRSMALVHEKFYDSKDFTRIDLTEYVRTLSQELFQSYKTVPEKIDLIIQIHRDVYMDINKVIPCGMILNELISNALKHAFPGDRQGELQIIIYETKNTEVEIIVCDNGVSLPNDVDIHQPRTVGLYLVNGLVKNQLDGQIEVRRGAGTEFRIKFPL